MLPISRYPSVNAYSAGLPVRQAIRRELAFGWNARKLPNPDVPLTERDFIDKRALALKPEFLDRCIAKLLDDEIGFIRIPEIERLLPDVVDRENLIASLPLAIFERNPQAFMDNLKKHLLRHPHGQNLQEGFRRDSRFERQLRVDYSVGYREHGNRFLDPNDTIYRGHYVHHEYTGKHRGADQVVLLLTNGYWGFKNLTGTEPMVMDMEEYRQDYNRKPGVKPLPVQPKIIGGDKDPVFLPGDPRLDYSYIAQNDYSKHADIFILNNLRVGHGRMPGQWIPPLEAMKRPLYQHSLTIGKYGRTLVVDLIDEKAAEQQAAREVRSRWNPLRWLGFDR
jgi:hypothetical protein